MNAIEKRIAAQKLLYEAREDERKEYLKNELPTLKKLIGSTWKYRNCYSSPETESDYWWIYMKIISVNNEGYGHACRIQTDNKGKITVDTRIEYLCHDHFSNNWEKISKKEWQAEFKKIKTFLSIV